MTREIEPSAKQAEPSVLPELRANRVDMIKPIQIDLSQYEQLTRALRPLDSLFVEDCELGSLEASLPPGFELRVLPDPEPHSSSADQDSSRAPIV